MIKTLKINLELMEMMYYYWKASSEKEKVGERFIYSVIEHAHMATLYSDAFTPEMARQVLSAISNREVFKPQTKASARYWNNNMWMMEDLGITDGMFQPIKSLNLDHFIDNSAFSNAPESVEIIFVPGHFDTCYRKNTQLYINFFKLMTDFVDGSIRIEGQTLQDFMEAQLE